MKKNEVYEYVGCFFKWDDLEKAMEHIECAHLYRMIKCPHITFSYMPEYLDEALFGEKVLIKIVGYGNDGKNEGLKVELVSGSVGLRTAFEKIEVPHITVSVSADGEPVNTRYLNYVPIEEVELMGIYGGYDEERETVFFEI